MSLYPKKLRNVEELELEQLRLKKQLDKLNDQDIFQDMFSVGNILGSFKKGSGGKSSDGEESAAGGGIMSIAMGLLPMAQPLLGSAMEMVKAKILNMGADKPKKEKLKNSPDAESKKEKKKEGKSMVRAVVFELVTGYLKWKAIELSYKGAKYLIAKRRQNKAMRELEEEMG